MGSCVEPIQRGTNSTSVVLLPAVWRYRRLLGEVLFAFHIAAINTYYQVIIDKVMVQESLPTLDVMAIALLGVAVFEAFLVSCGYSSLPARRLDLSLSAQVFRHLMRHP